MPNSDDDDVDPAYVAIFTQHVNDFRTHLTGRDETEPLLASYFAPRAYWTSAEKDAFFRGLSVHSRLRPDLIAEEVKTKAVPDVSVYIAMLEQAERELSKEEMWDEDDRAELPIAFEVSEDWLAFEERAAKTLAQANPDQEAIKREREEEVQLRRKSMRKGYERAVSRERDRMGERQRREEFDQWLEQKRSEWEKEDALFSLDRAALTTLDRMIREDEEKSELGCRTQPKGKAILVPEIAGQNPVKDAPMSGIDDNLIDPVLLEISRVGSTSVSSVPMREAVSTHITSHELDPPCSTMPSQPNIPPYTPALLPAIPIQAPITSTSNVPAPSTTSRGSSVVAEDPSQMSPASRRRYQKRLHMRRKRAEAAGTVANEDIGRLKPGRKPKKRLPKARRFDTPDADALARITTEVSSPMAHDTPEPSSSAVRGMDEEDDGVGYRHPHASGLTLPYKRHAELLSKGVDVQRIREAGLDLFHLQALSKLMQTYNQLHDIAPDVGSEVSAETLTLLRILVVNFLAQVMSRAIVWREQERIAKLHTKVWHKKENQGISAPVVKHALALYGADSLNKREHFANLRSRLGLEDSDHDGEQDDVDAEDEETHQQAEEAVLQSSDPVDADEANGEHDAASDDEDVPALSLLRTIFPPFLNPSLSLSSVRVGANFDSVDPSVYMPWPPSANATDLPNDEDILLLPNNIDEQMLVQELLEDEQLDKLDKAREAEEENALWDKVNTTSAGPRASESAGDTGSQDKTKPGHAREAEQLRKRKRQDVDGLCGKGAEGGTGVEASLQGAEWDAEADMDEEMPRARRKRTAIVKRELDTDESRAHPRKTKKGKGKDIAQPSQWQLMYREPDPNSRIKSKVYISDSD